jgi:CheY-like chemotaxis protein
MSKSILLADDSATIRKVVELTFSDTEFHIESVSSGAEAVERLEALRPDVVLADVVMPEPTGYEICRRIKSSGRPVPVLLLAGTFEAFDHEQARACGADGCLLKPFESRTLLDRVTSLLADRDAVTTSPVEPVASDPEPAETAAVPSAMEVEELRAPETEPVEIESIPDPPPGIDSETIDAIVQAVVHRLSEDVVRQIASDVVPRVAETVIRERIRELESEDS